MPAYRYTAIGQDGKEVRGAIDGGSVAEARRKLKDAGRLPIDVSEETARAGISRFTSSGPSPDFLPLFTRQLATLCDAGVPLVAALDALAPQADDPESRQLLESVRDAVKGGSSLAHAIEANPKFFPDVYAGMVRAGEEGGMLGPSLSRLADYLEMRQATATRLRAALAYPVLMAVIGFGVVFFLMAFVVPKIVGVFSHLGKALPIPTRILITLSSAIASSWWAILLLLAIATIFYRRFVATPSGRLRRDTLLVRLPVIGRILHISAVSRFARTLSALCDGGVPVDRGLRVAAPVTGNAMVEAALIDATAKVVEGSSLSNALAAHRDVFPTSIVQMARVGEESGRLAALLAKASDALDRETDARLSRSLSLLEPLIILFMGGVVALIVVAVMLPLLDLSNIAR